MLHTNESPYLVLWYLYLVFLGAVIAINLVAFLFRSFFNWRVRRLLARHTKVEQ